MMRVFGYGKARYRGRSKNAERLGVFLGLRKWPTVERHLEA